MIIRGFTSHLEPVYYYFFCIVGAFFFVAFLIASVFAFRLKMPIYYLLSLSLLVIGNLFAWLKLTRPHEHAPTLEWKNDKLFQSSNMKSAPFAVFTDCFSVVPISLGITLLSINMNKQ